MKIVHIAPSAPYNDYWGYQDNLLPKYHKKLGHDVTIITTNTMHQDGKIVETECADYTLNDGVRVIRLARKQYFHRVLTNLHSHLEVLDILKELKPDFVFFHGLVSSTILEVVKYKKTVNPDCVIVQDNHMDDYNSGSNRGTTQTLVRFYRRFIVSRSIKHISKVYGVTPLRKEYAENYFGVDKNKTDVLIMGADDEKLNFNNRDDIREKIRTKHDIATDKFLVVTGGKIDSKKNIHLLMKACSKINNVHLLIFGEIESDISNEVGNLLSAHNNLTYIGWISADETYNYFLAADLIAFPGLHSVMWEQACASKTPCLFSELRGTDHVNNGGNSKLVATVTIESLKCEIERLVFTPEYCEMVKAANSPKTDIFLYSEVAKKSLECKNDENS